MVYIARYICINCGTFIRKIAITDPYVCRDCEKIMEGAEPKEGYPYLDKY